MCIIQTSDNQRMSAFSAQRLSNGELWCNCKRSPFGSGCVKTSGVVAATASEVRSIADLTRVPLR